jgi:hypothetical protein
MAAWTAEQVAQVASPEEVQVLIRRSDGSLGQPTTIWIVAEADRLFVRSTNGSTAKWFRGAIATGSGQIVSGSGQIVSGGAASEVSFAPASEAELPADDAAYRKKYGRYPSIVDHLVEPGPREATLQVLMA